MGGSGSWGGGGAAESVTEQGYSWVEGRKGGAASKTHRHNAHTYTDIHTQIERQTHKHKQTQTDTHTDRHRHAHTDTDKTQTCTHLLHISAAWQPAGAAVHHGPLELGSSQFHGLEELAVQHVIRGILVPAAAAQRQSSSGVDESSCHIIRGILVPAAEAAEAVAVV